MTVSPELASPPAAALDAIRRVVGSKGVVEGAERAAFLGEWRKRWSGDAALIVAPASVDEVSRVVAVCADHKVAIVPQGGNTGLVGGQIPFGAEVLVSLKRLRTIRNVSPLDNTMSVDAGVTLAEAQEAARAADRLFPLSIGSEGSCQIGGVISTNAGGVNVVRYGNMRDLVLGLEVVLPDGRLWNGLKRLRKDNTGYDLKQLFIGGEGTLGIVTGAVLKLFPRPREVVTAFAGTPSARAAVELLSHAQSATGGLVSSFELISRFCLDLVLKHIGDTRDPLTELHPHYVLAEFSSSGADLRAAVEGLLASAVERGLVADAVIAESIAQSKGFWRLRHSISEALGAEGPGSIYDVSVATADIPDFLDRAADALRTVAPGARIVAFGHIGDGNIHYHVAPAAGAARDSLAASYPTIDTVVFDLISSFNGSFSAEHGIGRCKRAVFHARKSAAELDMMRAVKRALDPMGIMNPGKLF